MAGSSLSPVVQGVFTPLRLLLVAAVYIKLCHGSAGVVDTTVAFSTTDLIGSPTVATTSSPTIPATSSTTSSTTVSTTSSTTVPTTSSTVFEGSMVSEKKCSTDPTGSTDSADPTDFTRPKSPEILVSSTSSASFVTSVTSVTVRKTVPCYSVSNSTGGYKDNTRIPDIFNYCCPDVEDGVYGVVHWPTTRAGHHSSQKCPFGSRKDPEGRYGIAKAYRACERYTSVGPKWKPSDYSRCKAQGSDERDAAESAEEAERITSNPANITGETFRQATEMIEKSHQLAFSNRTVARSMLQAMSNLVAASPKAQQDGDADGQQRLKLFLLMESHGRGVVMPDEERRYEQRMSNLHLVVQKVPPAMETLPSTFNFNVNFIDSSEDTSLLRLAPDGGPPGDLRSPTSSKVRIVLPKEAIEQVLKKNPDTHLSEVRLRFMAMRNARLLPPPGTQSGMQNVVSASISPTQSDEEVGKDFEVRDLRTPVKIRMPFGKWGATHVCSYYDIKTDEWKSDGLRTLLDQGDEVECESNHLTPFSLLLDPYPRNGLGDLIVPLEIVSYLGSVLSILGLTATIITYQFFSRFGKDRWSRVLVQLCTSLLLLHLTYLSSNLKGAIPPECCAAVAALLHVFLLSSFFWMLVEAMLLYQLLITVFQSANSKFMLKRLVFAWGLPVLIVVASAAVEPRYYFDTHSDFCLPSAYNRVQHSVTAILPCCTVLVINVIIFIRISFVLLRRRIPPGFRSDTNETPTVTWAQVRGMIGVAFLLGVTWVLSPLSMDMVALQLASSAVNALQGVAIFVSRVLTHPEARRSWKHRFFPKNEFLSTSATYSVSDKGSSWFRIRWSVTSGTVATAPSPPKEGKDSARSRRLSTLWSKQMSPSRGSSSLSLGVTRNGSETYLT